ncbi:MAG: CobD/CbiB family cobalamin biosynthesis protein, partial [Cyanobacteria bacterium P01_A01_bin.135]
MAMADALPIAAVWGMALLLDYAIGDPWGCLHPVQVMGWAIQRYTEGALSLSLPPLWERLAGVGLTLGLIGGSVAVGCGLHDLAQQIHPLLAFAVDSTLLASCLAARSLRDAADDVLAPLQKGDLLVACDRLSRYVGRDTDQLGETEVLRAVLETVSENATDGVMGPLFFGLVGM